MGCDIHLYVEYKKTVKDVKKWLNGDYFKFNPYHKVYDNEHPYNRIELYGDRNYGLFSTLAGVRDYTEGMTPVSEPKGLPHDVTEYVQSESTQWGSDGHTHSWLTLKELKDYQAIGAKLKRTGLLSPEQLLDFDKGILPQSWCQGTNQPGYERREWEEENNTLVPLIKKLQQRAHELMQYDWEEYKIENDENVRIVFWFDN